MGKVPSGSHCEGSEATPSKPVVKPTVKKPAVTPESKVAPKLKKAESAEKEQEDKKPGTPRDRKPASSELASQLESLHEKIDKLEQTIERLRRRTPSVFGRFFADLAKVIFLAALLTVAWQTGWVNHFLEWAAGLDLSAIESWLPKTEE